MPDAGVGAHDGDDPQGPHWYQFAKVNDLPNDWRFEVIAWDDAPSADGIVDWGEAEIVRGDHRFVVTTYLKPRERTHDRIYSVAYETVNQDGEDELLAFHIGKSQDIARNNLGHARQVLDQPDIEPHVLVRDHTDDPRETFEFPAAYMAENAADLQTRLKLEDDDRDYLVTVHAKDKWEERVELEQSLPGESDA